MSNKIKTIMKIKDLRIGTILKDNYGYKAEVIAVYENSFEVQYISGACWTYRQEDLDSEKLTLLIG